MCTHQNTYFAGVAELYWKSHVLTFLKHMQKLNLQALLEITRANIPKTHAKVKSTSFTCNLKCIKNKARVHVAFIVDLYDYYNYITTYPLLSLRYQSTPKHNLYSNKKRNAYPKSLMLAQLLESRYIQ